MNLTEICLDIYFKSNMEQSARKLMGFQLGNLCHAQWLAFIFDGSLTISLEAVNSAVKFYFGEE